MNKLNSQKTDLSGYFTFFYGEYQLNLSEIQVARYQWSNLDKRYWAIDLTDPKSLIRYFDTEKDAQLFCFGVLKRVVDKLILE